MVKTGFAVSDLVSGKVMYTTTSRDRLGEWIARHADYAEVGGDVRIRVSKVPAESDNE